MSSSNAAADNQGMRLQSHFAPEEQNALALRMQVESLRVLAQDLLSLVARMEEFQSRSLQQPVRLSEEVRRFEKGLIESALKLTGGQQTRAARLLGVKLTTLHSKIKKYRIQINPPALRAADAPRQGCAPANGKVQREDDCVMPLRGRS
jgi:transcriptional regulator with GAF, ATPase, and Fis domain